MQARRLCQPLRKRLCILGSTGSVGRQTLQVIRDHPERFQVVGLSAHRSIDALSRQAAEFQSAAVCLSEPGAKVPRSDGGPRWLSGPEGLLDLIEAVAPDLVVVAVVGAAGLAPTLRALERGLPVALANKETLVTGGELVMAAARARGVPILPMDSEHSAIAQCLAEKSPALIRRIVLTASGGPFRGRTRAALETVTVEEALRHPTWRMGPKITIDSATLMNKGFEIIEGAHLFSLPVDRFEIVIHPQSTLHAAVEFLDGSMLAQMAVPDMALPIAQALAWPERLCLARLPALDLAALGTLAFERPDPTTFPCLELAREAARRGGTFPAALNAANEVAVARFLAGELRFLEIPEVIEAVLEAHESLGAADLTAIFEADAWARRRAAELSFSRR